MNPVAPVLLSIVAVGFQAFAAQSFSIVQFVPHFPLLFVCYFGARETLREALIAALVSGILLDTLSLDPWGANTLSFVMLVLVLRRARRSGWFDSPVPSFAATGFAIRATAAMRAGVVSLLGGRLLPIEHVLAVGAYTWILAIPVTTILDGIRPVITAPGRRATW